MKRLTDEFSTAQVGRHDVLSWQPDQLHSDVITLQRVFMSVQVLKTTTPPDTDIQNSSGMRILGCRALEFCFLQRLCFFSIPLPLSRSHSNSNPYHWNSIMTISSNSMSMFYNPVKLIFRNYSKSLTPMPYLSCSVCILSILTTLTSPQSLSILFVYSWILDPWPPGVDLQVRSVQPIAEEKEEFKGKRVPDKISE